jgi:hypothetical protein
MYVATAGKVTLEVTDLYSTGTTVTGVLTAEGSSDVCGACLQELKNIAIPADISIREEVLKSVGISFFIE